MQRALTIAWLSYFPVEWLPEAPAEIRNLPRRHPASWQRVLLEELEQNPGIKLHVLVLRKQFQRDLTFERRGVTFHLLKIPGGWRAPSLFWADTWRLRRRLAEIRPAVVHAWGTEQGAALVAGRLKYPYVVTVQGLLTWYRELVPLARYQRFAARLEQWSLPRSPVVTTESTQAVDYIRRRWPGTKVRQVEHAPDWIFHRLERRPKTRPVKFIFVGTFSQIKGGDLLLGALDRLKHDFEFELVIVGEPEARWLETLRRGVSPELWRWLRFKKNLRPAEVADELATATMLLFPTRADTSPNSVKEAVVAGVPVVASALGGILDYVWPGRNGLLFTPGNVEEFTAAIRAACAHPLFGQGQVEAGALREAREYLSPKRMGESFFHIYQELAETCSAAS